MFIVIEMPNACLKRSNKIFSDRNNIAIQINSLDYFQSKPSS